MCAARPGRYGDRVPTLRARASALLAVLPLVVALVAAPSAATPSSSHVSSPPAPTGRCTDLLVLSVRGSGESTSTTKTSAVRDAFLDGVDGRRTTTVETLPYPAAAMSVLADDFRQLIDLGLPGTSDWSYFRSIETGAQVLRERLSTARRTCPDQKWALIGYSQGAMVISEVLPEFPDPQLYAGVMLVANPSRSAGDRQDNIGTAMPGNGLSSWVPPAGLGYDAVPHALAGVTTDLCASQDLVCDTARLFANLAAPVTGVPWEPIVGIAALVEYGTAVHTAYDVPELSALAGPAIERASRFVVPEHRTVTVLACGPSGDVSAAVPVKALSTAGAAAQRRTVEPALLTGALSGATFTEHGFTRGPYRLDLADDGRLTGTLPAGRWELVTTATTGLEPPRTIRVVVHVDTAGTCGGVDGYVTDRDGEPVEGAEVWLERTTDGWDGESDRRLAMDRTDSDGYYAIVGSYDGEYLLFFSDGPPTAQTWEQSQAEGYVDLFDQYHSTQALSNDSASPSRATPVHVGGPLARTDQALSRASSVHVYAYDGASGRALEGIAVSEYGWGAVTRADGWAFHTGRWSYGGCRSYFDTARVYVEMAGYDPRRPAESSVRMVRGSSVTGTVRDERGRPVPGAMVHLSRERSWDPAAPDTDWGGGTGCYSGLGTSESRQAVTDANGRYRIGALYGGVNPYLLHADLGTTILSAAPVTLPPARTGYQDVEVDLGFATLTAATPTVSGTAKVGVRLTAKRGTWTTGTSFAYQWSVNGKAVAGATGTTFTPRAADVGRTVTVRVTGTKPGYVTATRTSKATAAVVKGTLTTARPTVTGTPKVGARLTAYRGTWTAGTTFSYRWYANGKAISGASSTTYTLKASDRGKVITVKVTGSKPGYVTATTTSKATAAVR